MKVLIKLTAAGPKPKEHKHHIREIKLGALQASGNNERRLLIFNSFLFASVNFVRTFVGDCSECTFYKHVIAVQHRQPHLSSTRAPFLAVFVFARNIIINFGAREK